MNPIKDVVTLIKAAKIVSNKIPNVLFKFIGPIEDKEYYIPKGLKVMCADLKTKKNIMKKVKYIMRHRCKKKMYRVWITNTQYVDVTEDHSLIGYVNIVNRKKYGLPEFIEVKPKDIGKVSKSLVLLNRYFRSRVVRSVYDKDMLYLMGYFMANGCFLHNRCLGKTPKYVGLSFGNDIEDYIPLLRRFPMLLLKFARNPHIFSLLATLPFQILQLLFL